MGDLTSNTTGKHSLVFVPLRLLFLFWGMKARLDRYFHYTLGLKSILTYSVMLNIYNKDTVTQNVMNDLKFHFDVSPSLPK